METFETKYKDWDRELNQKQIDKYKSIEKLVLSINKDLKEEVKRSYKKNNSKIRNAISEKIGFSLKNPSFENDTSFESKERVSLPIKVEDSVPSTVLDILGEFDDNLIELLLRYNSMVAGLNELKFQLSKYQSLSKYHKEKCTVKDIQSAISHLNYLIGAVDSSGILEKLKQIGPSTLGAYYFYDREVKLYWLSIGFYCLIFNLPIDDLTIVVLTHELAHGYSHVGFDIDGNVWDTEAFSHSDLKIVEGIAQFYTESICNDYFDRSITTFNHLFEHQNIEYRDYRNWFDDRVKNKYEIMRGTIRKIRKNNITHYDHFRDILEKMIHDA